MNYNHTIIQIHFVQKTCWVHYTLGTSDQPVHVQSFQKSYNNTGLGLQAELLNGPVITPWPRRLNGYWTGATSRSAEWTSNNPMAQGG